MRGGKAGAHFSDYPRGPIPHVVILKTQHTETLRGCVDRFGFVVRLHVSALMDRTINLDQQPRAITSEVKHVIADRWLATKCLALNGPKQLPQLLL